MFLFRDEKLFELAAAQSEIADAEASLDVVCYVPKFGAYDISLKFLERNAEHDAVKQQWSAMSICFSWWHLTVPGSAPRVAAFCAGPRTKATILAQAHVSEKCESGTSLKY